MCVVCLDPSANVCETVRNSSATLVTDLTSVSLPKEKSGKKPHFLLVPFILLLFCSTLAENPQASIPHCYLIFLLRFFIWPEFHLWPQRNFGLRGLPCACFEISSSLFHPVPPSPTKFQSSHTSYNLDSVVPGLDVQKVHYTVFPLRFPHVNAQTHSFCT